MYKMTVSLLATALVLLAGCSVFNRNSQIVALTIDPPDAKVIANGVNYNSHTSDFIVVSPGNQLILTIYKEGYEDKKYVVDCQLSSTGKIDAWSSILLFPALGLFSDGAWELKENNITIKLDKIHKPKEDKPAAPSNGSQSGK